MCCRRGTTHLHAYGILFVWDEISSLAGSILDTQQCGGTKDQERYQGKDRKVVIGCEILHDNQLAVASKQYQQGADTDEEAQDAGEFSGSIFSRHGCQQDGSVEDGPTRNPSCRGDGYVVCQTFCVSTAIGMDMTPGRAPCHAGAG